VAGRGSRDRRSHTLSDQTGPPIVRIPLSGTQAVERMRTSVEELGIVHPNNPRGILTVSAGRVHAGGGHTQSSIDVLKEADGVLYRAKDRNRVEHIDRALADQA
jgi:GGDEF domain-containing protein